VGNVLLLPTFSLNGGQEKDLAHPTTTTLWVYTERGYKLNFLVM
jgi:hypothetical protein